MKTIKTLLVVFAFIGWSTKVNAQLHSTQFCTGIDSANYGGGWFSNQDTLNFYDHSTGPIIQWTWLFHGADNNDTILTYSTFTPMVTRVWSTAGHYRVSLTTIDTFGISIKYDVAVNIAFTTTSIKKNTENSFSVYPNPAKDDLNITFARNEKEDTAQVFDITGRLIASFEVSGQQKIDVSSFENGIYFCKVGSENTFRKFEVSH